MIFSPFERMVAKRYLRARRQEGFISVIAVFSLLGIALGVATLIIVMSVMNGFRHELLSRVLGLNGQPIQLDTTSLFPPMATSSISFAGNLPAEVGVAGVPVSAFCADPGLAPTLVRLAICKDESVLREGARRLATVGRGSG